MIPRWANPWSNKQQLLTVAAHEINSKGRVMEMRHTIFSTILLILAAPFAMAGAGNDQPTNIVVNNPYSNNINWAQVCWSTNNQSDSLVMIGENPDFSRQVYDSTLTTSHCVVVKNLQPNTQYFY